MLFPSAPPALLRILAFRWLAALLAAVCAQPALAQVIPPDPPPSFARQVGGEWGPVLVWPHVPVSMASLPDGRILTFASNEPNRFPGSLNDEYTHAAVWDPVTGEIVDVPHPSHDMFCAALVTLESGEPLVMGGRNQGLSPWTSYYDYHTDEWVQIEDMNRGRWYPTAVYLGTGEVLIAAGVGGGVNPELWNPQDGWKLLTGIDLSNTILQFGTRDGAGSWPLLQLAPDGTVFHHGATDTMNSLDPFGGPGGLGTLTGLGPHNFGWFADEGVSVLYDKARILVAGGSFSTGNDTAVAGAWKIDISGPAPVLTRAADMNFPRQFQNEVMLPTGEVLVVGGNTSGVKFTDGFAVKNAEAWDPESDTWTLLNAQDQARAYHSTAVLLADGRVISAGGGLAGDSCANPEGPGECQDDHWNAEIFSPPYLFAADGSPAARPSIDAAPGVTRVGATFPVQATPGLSDFSMVRLSATTHTMNTDQRFLRADFVETSPGSYELTLEPNPNVLVPGYWMLFAMDGSVPSVSHVIQVVNDGTPRGKPIQGLRHAVGENVLVQIQAEDPDGNALAFVAGGLPDGLAIDADTGAISGVPSQAGVFNVVVTASDGSEAGVVSFPWVISTLRSEVGTLVVSQADRSQWHTVNLAAAFQDPIVVMGPLGSDDPAPATLRVRNVTPTSFQFQIEEWSYQNGAHGAEEVSYLVVEKGEYLLPDGSALVAGRSVGVDYENPRLQALPAQAFVQTPLVLAQVASHNGTRAVVPRVSNVSTTQFEVRIQGEEALSNNLAFENLHWIALEPASIASELEAASVFPVDHLTRSFAYGQLFSGLPHLLATAQTRNGTNPAGVRRQGATAGSVELIMEEEQSADSELVHPDEVVGYLAVDPLLTSLGLLPLFNQAPIVATPAPQTNLTGEAVSLFVSANDPDGDTLDFSALGLPAGLAIDPESGEVSGTATAPGLSVVTVTATDPTGDSGHAVFVWTIENPPLLLLEIPSPPALEGALVAWTAATLGPVPGALFEWDFGDGFVAGPSTSPDASHAYGAPGRYIVTLRATDPGTGLFDEIQFVQNVTGAPTALRPTASSSIAYDAATDRVWAVNPDNDSVQVIDATSDTGIAEIPVCDGPRSVAVAGNGHVWVACRDSSSIDVLDAVSLVPQPPIVLAPGSGPYGIVFDPTGAAAYVALEEAGRVLKLDGVSGAELASADVGPHVRQLAVTADGATVHVTRHVTPLLPGEESGTPTTGPGLGGEVLSLDAATLLPGATVILEASPLPDSEQSARGIPNYLGAPAISPQGTEMLIPSKQDNVLRGANRDGLELSHDVTVRAVSSRVDLLTGSEHLIARIDHDNASVASATVYSLSGAYAFTTLEGNRQVSVIDPLTHFELGRALTGRAPHGLALSPDGSKLYVDDFMDRTVTVLGLQDLRDYDDPALPQLAVVTKVANEALAPDVLVGKQLFYDAADPRLSLESYMACASCHNEAGHDGRVWDFGQFGEGMRNTITLRGHGEGHGPLHWTANFDEVHDFEGQIRGFAGGTGLMSDPDFAATADPLGAPKAGLSADLDALAAYVESLTLAGRSPFRAADGSLTPAGQAGRDVFEAEDCGSCHSGVAFTDSATLATHDVGTLGPVSGPQTALDTPTLRGVWGSAPYLHDGSAPDLAAAVNAHAGVSLAGQQLADLVAYLQQIDDLEPGAPNGELPPDWWDVDWTQRVQLSFDNSASSEDLVSFPVLVTLDPGFDYASAGASGADLRFVDAGGVTLLSHEIETWEEGGTSQVWVKVPRIDAGSSTDHVWLYYGNPSVADGQDAAGVWSSGYRGVWHLAGDALDSSPYGNHGVLYGGAAPVSGRIGEALWFNGGAAYVDAGADPSLAVTGPATLEAWVQVDPNPGNKLRRVLSKKDDLGATEGFNLAFRQPRDRVQTYGVGTSYGKAEPAGIGIGQWHHLMAVLDGTGLVRFYVDGVDRTTDSGLDPVLAGGAPLRIGGTADGSNHWKGLLDEVRIAAAERSADWAEAQYRAMTGTFVSVGASTANQPPTVSLTAPADGTVVVLPPALDLAADASDPDGSVVRVDFWAGGTWLGEDTSAPYALSWPNPPVGIHDLVAVAVDDGGATTPSTAVQVTVEPAPTPPSITAQPASLAALVGESGLFGVAATGTAPLAYQWRRDGVDLPGETDSLYLTPPLDLGDDGASFDVVVSNLAGSVTSDAAVLTVTEPPNLLPLAFFTATPPGGVAPLAVEFDATGSGDPDGTIVQFDWDFGDGHVDSGPSVSHTFTSDGAFDVTLTVTDDDGATAEITSTVNVGNDWWDVDWTQRVQLVFDNGASGEDLVSFPVLVTLDPGFDYASAGAGGADLRFVDADGLTLLSHEIESWVEGGTSQVWVKVPRIDAGSSADFVWLYYGNPAVADGQDPAGVWSSGYRGVWHLAGDGLDSSGFGNDGVVQGPSSATGRIGEGLSFDGLDDYVDAGADASLALTGPASFEAWVQVAANAGNKSRRILSKKLDRTDVDGFNVEFRQAKDALRALGSGRSYAEAKPANLGVDTWHHVMVVADADGLVQVYIDGVDQTTDGGFTPLEAGSTPLSIGRQSDGSNFWKGLLDEVRVAAAARSADWALAQYKAMTGAFVQVVP